MRPDEVGGEREVNNKEEIEENKSNTQPRRTTVDKLTIGFCIS